MNTPSDEEIVALAQQHLKAFVQFSLGEGPIPARAGQPCG